MVRSAPYEGRGHGEHASKTGKGNSRQRTEPLRSDARRPAGALPDAGHEPVEFAPARFPADRGNGRGALPVLRGAVRAQACQIIKWILTNSPSPPGRGMG